ncbi:transmembrane 9 superfamily member 11-like [Ananas comosus]|uniref:Transmembrane 9 superfamily member n=2 Tax=Ananas comosus TaxID=4615 RepID=A0A6P5GN16_ANACO|nr:transmembrane 9 superfamily member 11-like [Ananas comosus]
MSSPKSLFQQQQQQLSYRRGARCLCHLPGPAGSRRDARASPPPPPPPPPPPAGPRPSAESLGELLLGDRIQSSPYLFRMRLNASRTFLCSSPPLSPRDFALLRQRVDAAYSANLVLDNLPAINVASEQRGFPIGARRGDDYFIFNHLKFTVRVHGDADDGDRMTTTLIPGTGDVAVEQLIPRNATDEEEEEEFMVVGFEVAPCSVRHDRKLAERLDMYDEYPAPIECDARSPGMRVAAGERVAFTYDVEFVGSAVRWPSRWDAYLRSEGGAERVHWLSILGSLAVVAMLAAVAVAIMLRTVRRDLARYEALDAAAEAKDGELSGWKLVAGDAFRPPSCPLLLCVLVGEGVQILGMAAATIFFAALGFMSPAARGALISGMLLFFLVLGTAGGYAAARLWKTLNSGDPAGWPAVSWRVACAFPGLASFILAVLNCLLSASHSTGALPSSLLTFLLFTWFCISVPLTLVGGFFGAKAPHVEFPTPTNQIPREVPMRRYPPWLLVLAAGALPFATLFVELLFIFSSLWMGRVYYVFGFLLLVLGLFVVVCAEVALVLTYVHLCAEDWRWWWKAFFAPGSVAVYVLVYAVKYLVFDLKSLSGPVSAALYLGYSLLMVLAVMLAAGTVGFVSSFWFVHYLFSSVKID